MELRFAANRTRRTVEAKATSDALLKAPFQTPPFSVAYADYAAAVSADLASKGQMTGPFGALSAAQALTLA